MNKNIKRIIAATLVVSAFYSLAPVNNYNFLTTEAHAASNDSIYLDSISVSSGSDVKLSKSKTSYKSNVSRSKDYVTIRVKTKSSSDEVTIDGETPEESSSRNFRLGVDLDKGNNKFDIVVKNGDKERTYKLTIYRGSSSSSSDDKIYLSSISLSEGDIDFSKKTTSYDITVPTSTDEIRIKAKPEDDDYIVTIDGDEVDEDDNYRTDVSLSKGNNKIKIEIEDDDGNQRTYTLNIYRGKKSDSDSSNSDSQDDIYLDDITLSDGTIKFSKKTSVYDVNVKEDVDELRIKAEPEDEDYTVEIDGYIVDDDDNYKRTVDLEKGKNVIKIDVTDDDDNKRTYTLNVYRGTSSNNGSNNSEGNTNGSLKTNQWVEYGTNTGIWKYHDAAGNPIKSNWFTDRSSGKTYYLQADGTMAMGWFYNNGKWYYLNPYSNGYKGAMLTGWQYVNGSWYYMDSAGVMKTGWFRDLNGAWYYLNSNGTMQIAPKYIDGKLYKFYSNGAWIG